MADKFKKLPGSLNPVSVKAESKTPITTPHHSGKGTRSRLNTAAEKMMFGNRSSN